MASRKRARTAGEGEEEGEAVPVAGGFEAPIFGSSFGVVTTLALEGEDGPLASLLRAVASDRAGGWYVTTPASVLHVSAAGRIRTVATCEDCRGPNRRIVLFAFWVGLGCWAPGWVCWRV